MEDRGDNTIAYAANAVNEYTTIGGVSVAYDACGNLSQDAAGYQYFYDHDNRLTQVQDSGDNVKAEYAYDATGRRIRTILGGVTTKYYYDGQRVILETDNAGTTDERMFAYGNYIDEVLVMEKLAGDNQGMYYYGHDHLFSVCILFDDGGAITEYTEYDAYGYARTGTAYGVDQTWFTADDAVADGGGSNVANPYFFTGRRLDLLDAGALPLMYYRARMYDPATGRFLQRDPLNNAGICVHAMSASVCTPGNAYEYCLSEPTRGLDPFGLEWTYSGNWRVRSEEFERRLPRTGSTIRARDEVVKLAWICLMEALYPRTVTMNRLHCECEARGCGKRFKLERRETHWPVRGLPYIVVRAIYYTQIWVPNGELVLPANQAAASQVAAHAKECAEEATCAAVEYCCEKLGGDDGDTGTVPPYHKKICDQIRDETTKTLLNVVLPEAKEDGIGAKKIEFSENCRASCSKKKGQKHRRTIWD